MKTCEEWSLEFDLLYNNIASNKAPGIEEYEKSVFLTRAQNAVVVALYNGSLGTAFESTEEITEYLGTLVKQETHTSVGSQQLYKLNAKSEIFPSPADMLFRTWEGCNIDIPGCGTELVSVVPVTQDEYWRTVRNPFKKQNKSKVLRLSYSKNETENEYLVKGYTELISDYPIVDYTVRYLSKPTPIILEDLSLKNLSIDGYTAEMTCKLPESIHQTILSEAVRMAKAHWNA